MKLLTYYDVLSVKRDSPPGVIRAAYKALAQTWHPDRNDAAEAASTMQTINFAYNLLSDPVLRAEYDALLEARDYQEMLDNPRIWPNPGEEVSSAFVVDGELLMKAVREKEERDRKNTTVYERIFRLLKPKSTLYP